MLAETILRRVAFACAAFLLLGPLGGRTTWVRGHVTATDAAVYNVVTVLSGIIALAALVVALRLRPRVVAQVLAVVTAITAFGLTIVVAGVYVLARLQGHVWSYAGWSISSVTDDRRWLVYPAWGPPFFMIAALVGAVASLILAISWLRHPTGDATPRVLPM